MESQILAVSFHCLIEQDKEGKVKGELEPQTRKSDQACFSAMPNFLRHWEMQQRR